METCTYVVEGKPIPLARPRFGRGRCWDEQKLTKVVFGIHLVKQHDSHPFFEGPLQLLVKFFMPIPKRARNKDGKPHYIKPDLSNLIKFVEDVGSGILYEDDSVITSIKAEKIYSKKPRTEITVIQIG